MSTLACPALANQPDLTPRRLQASATEPAPAPSEINNLALTWGSLNRSGRVLNRAVDMANSLTSEHLLQRLLMKGRLRQFQMIVTVAEIGNMHQAARKLAVSQPAVTKVVRDIEAILELAIFERHSRGMRLTPAGRDIIPYLRRIIETTRLCVETVAVQHNTESTTVRIGAVAAGIGGVLAPHLSTFTKENPNVHVKVREIEGRQIEMLLAEGEHELLVCRSPDVVAAPWSFVPLLEDEHAIFAAPDHPLAKVSNLTHKDLKGCVWLIPPQGVPAQAIFERLVLDLSTENLCQIASRVPVLIRQAICQRQALAISPTSLFQSDLTAGALVRLDINLDSPISPVGMLFDSTKMGTASQVLMRYLIGKSTYG